MNKILVIVMWIFVFASLVIWTAGECSAKDRADIYIELLDDIEDLRYHQEKVIMEKCEGSSYFCYIANFYGLRKITGAMIGFGDELYWGTDRSIDEVKKDSKTLSYIIKACPPDFIYKWALIDMAWEDYLEEKEN